MRKKNKLILILMVALVMMISVPKTLAYFSTYARVRGTAPIVLKEIVKFNEEDIDGNKHVVIEADSDSDPVFVRVRAYATDEIMKYLSYVYEDGEWKLTADGWYEYQHVLMPGDEAVIDIEIEKMNIEVTQFNVIVVYEYIPAISDGQGGYVADWTAGWTQGGGN